MKRKFDETGRPETHGRNKSMRDNKPPGARISQCITCYDNLNHLKLSTPTEIETPKTHILAPVSEDYRIHKTKLVPYTNSDGVTFPLVSWMEIVPALNRYLKTCANGKMIKTFFRDDTQKPVAPPSGLHVFAVPREMTESLTRDALEDAKRLYWAPKHRADNRIHVIKRSPAPACNLLFYAGCGGRQPKIRDVFQILFAEAPALARYALMYLSAVRDILRLDDDEMDSVNMTLVHYDPMGGINPHIDTVFLFNGTLGPIFTIAMGPYEKALDVLPVLLPDTSYQSVRVFTKPNEIMLMDGESRALYAHGKPLEYPHEQFTLVFKCPEFRTKTHSVPFEYEGTTLSIPYHYVSPFDVSHAEVRD
jgi:hypothetical protein